MASPSDIPVLVQRLRSGSRVAQLQALKQLSSLATAGTAQRAALVADGIPPLVQLMGSSGSSGTAVQTAAVGLLWFLLESDNASRNAVAAAGGVPALVALLRQGSTSAQKAAATMLDRLADQNDERKAAILAAGAVEPLVQLLQHQDWAVLKAAVNCLHSLAGDSEPCGAAIADAGAIPSLVQLIPRLPEHAPLALGALAWGSEDRREAVAAAGAVAFLEQQLVSNSSSEAAKAAAVMAVDSLAMGDPDSQACQAASAVIKPLANCLPASNDNFLQCGVLSALARLAANSPANSAAILAAGVVPALSACLTSTAEGLASHSAWLINNMTDSLPCALEAVGSAGVIPGLVGLLQQKDEQVCGEAAWALHSLALNPANQQAILAAGGFEALLGLLQSSSSREFHVTCSCCGGYNCSGIGHDLKGTAAVALCTLAQGSEELTQAARAASAAAAIQQALPVWRSDEDAFKVVAAGSAALNFLLEDSLSNSSRSVVRRQQPQMLMHVAEPTTLRGQGNCMYLRGGCTLDLSLFVTDDGVVNCFHSVTAMLGNC